MGNRIAHALIGNTAKRSTWIGQTDGTLPTYEGPIPVSEVERRLFNWKALTVPTGNFIPCDVADADAILPDGRAVKIVVTEGAQGVVRSDDFTELGRHGSRWRAHDYNEWLIRNVSNVLQGTLKVLSALTLKNGAQAAVEIGLDETMHDDATGLDFWPFLLAQTSFDGSLATTYTAFNRMLVCDNMFRGIEAVGKQSGRQVKFKHTASSITEGQVLATREALSILDQTAHGMIDYVSLLRQVPVTDRQWISVLDIIEPPAGEGASKAATTKADNRRDALDDIYHGVGEFGHMNPYAGTALGVLQASNTYQHHAVGVRGTSRLERVYDRAMRGDFAKSDAEVLDAMAKVLDMPELAAV